MEILEFKEVGNFIISRDGGARMQMRRFRCCNWWVKHHCERCPLGMSNEWEWAKFGGCSGLKNSEEISLMVPVENWDRSRIDAAPCKIGDKIRENGK